MTITNQQFENLARLAYLNHDDIKPLLARCQATIEDIEQLQTVDTTNISPMHHPRSTTQYLRPDNHVIPPNVADLAQSAPAFVDNFYTVPLIIKSP